MESGIGLQGRQPTDELRKLAKKQVALACWAVIVAKNSLRRL